MLKELDTYDWREAFGYAGKEEESCANWQGIKPVCVVDFGEPVHTDPFNREDVAEIIGMQEGENDESDWVIVGRLKDGRYFSLEAGCDYTGWDCQASGFALVAKTREEIIKFGLNESTRKRLGL